MQNPMQKRPPGSPPMASSPWMVDAAAVALVLEALFLIDIRALVLFLFGTRGFSSPWMVDVAAIAPVLEALLLIDSRALVPFLFGTWGIHTP